MQTTERKGKPAERRGTQKPRVLKLKKAHDSRVCRKRCRKLSPAQGKKASRGQAIQVPFLSKQFIKLREKGGASWPEITENIDSIMFFYLLFWFFLHSVSCLFFTTDASAATQVTLEWSLNSETRPGGGTKVFVREEGTIL